jgi:hypothetical protein
MTYFCFIESSILSVPHMEPLDGETDTEARIEAQSLLDAHASGYAACVLAGEVPIFTLRRSDRPIPLPPKGDEIQDSDDTASQPG